MATTADIAKGIALRYKGDLYLVVEFQHVNPGKGSAFVRVRLKKVRTGKVVEDTFKSGEVIEVADLDKKKMQYLYRDQSGFYFMDSASYEQVSMSEAELGETARFLKEGLEVTLLMLEGKPVTLELPKKITYRVTSAPPVVKGDTASGRVTKEAILENEMKVQVPLFINEGDTVVVNAETGEYVERA